MTDAEKKLFVKQTLLTGSPARIKEVMLRYWSTQANGKFNTAEILKNEVTDEPVQDMFGR